MKRQERPKLYAIVLGLGVSILIAVITGGIISNAVLSGRVGEPVLPWVIAIALFCASLFGACIAGISESRESAALQVGVSCGFLIMLLLCGMLLFDGEIVSPWTQIGAISVGGIVSLLLNNKRKVKVTKKKHKNC